MTDTKYGKYFTTYEAKPEEIEAGRTGIGRLDSSMMEGSYFYWVHWNLPLPPDRPVFNPGVGHPPHGLLVDPLGPPVLVQVPPGHPPQAPLPIAAPPAHHQPPDPPPTVVSPPRWTPTSWPSTA